VIDVVGMPARWRARDGLEGVGHWIKKFMMLRLGYYPQGKIRKTKD
jgi:hypothetical protein